MFTGIIEQMGEVLDVQMQEENMHLIIKAAFVAELKPDQSIAHNGVCLTVTQIADQSYAVTAVRETLLKTNLGKIKTSDLVNLERCLRLGDRLDGHFVQGHIDTTAQVIQIEDAMGSWEYTFRLSTPQNGLMVSKGSIAVNGVSLTLIDPDEWTFRVAIIPYTYMHTNFKNLELGDMVNIEFDILGKYLMAKRP